MHRGEQIQLLLDVTNVGKGKALDSFAQIRNARLPHSHFECMLQAMQSSFIYDRLIISWVDDLPQPEQAAEVVDFMIRFEKVEWAVCGGVYQDQLILSVRTAIEEQSKKLPSYQPE